MIGQKNGPRPPRLARRILLLTIGTVMIFSAGPQPLACSLFFLRPGAPVKTRSSGR